MVKWIIFDRGSDLCTPFMSQLTLEGRLDELQNIAPGTGWLAGERGAGVTCRGSSQRAEYAVLIGSTDRCLSTLRDPGQRTRRSAHLDLRTPSEYRSIAKY
jgi:hypothetical protein